ncbi:MAG: hypothetical protein L0154_13150 [Chloroflexi bacterium]|nr:hypothetical protein [Chloroflexota bacterium]
MSRQNPQVLYIGSNPADVEPFAAHVFAATETLEALAIVVTYVPDAVVIDMRHPIAHDVLSHLESADWFDTPVLKINSVSELEKQIRTILNRELA